MSTVAAISSPFGRGGIAVIRISGESAISVAEKMFIPARGCDLSTFQGGRAVYGRIVSEGEMIDDGIATVFRAPNSFTGEDTVEISCHGGILLTERVLRTAFDCGAEQAGAGEFTQRAFMNGKIDLSRAEAVIGLIDAESEEKLKLCASHSEGILSKRCEELYSRLIKLVSSVYVRLDYPEEDLSEVSDAEFSAELTAIRDELYATERTYKQGKAVSEGIRTAIIGKPNVGKSSILNAIVGEEKAIVTSVAGTTRDVIEEKINVGRVTLRLFDTAGIRESDDEVERIGIERALKKAEEAELILAVFDATGAIEEDDEAIISILRSAIASGKPVITVMNKSDLGHHLDARSISPVTRETSKSDARREPVCLSGLPDSIAPVIGNSAVSPIPSVAVSARTGEGIDELKKLIESLYIEGDIDYRSVAVVANARQHAAISSARKAVERAMAAFEGGMGADVCGLDLEFALSSLGQVDGRAVTDEITNEIFHNFCVGK